MQKNSQKVEQKSVLNIKSLIIRTSPVPYFAKFFYIDFFIIIVLLIWHYIKNNFDLFSSAIFQNITIIYILLFILEVYLIIAFVLKWINNKYKITQDSITHSFGTIIKRKKVYVLRNIIKITMKQTNWQKLFKFGTILIETQMEDQPIYLKNILEPDKHLQTIKKIACQNQQPMMM
ncbi:PH domain-containing protein [Candidatus Dojkabacteria bacterium]|nr:PH domain-containing protein [Candidatus Dojkabacteria bacterium]